MTFEENASLVLTAPPSEQDEMLPVDPANVPHEAYDPEVWDEIDEHNYNESRRAQDEAAAWGYAASIIL